MSLKSSIACTRFGLGARTGEIASVTAPEEWLFSQVGKTTQSDFPGEGLFPSSVLLTSILEKRQTRTEAKRSGAGEEQIAQSIRTLVRSNLRAEVSARIDHGASTPDSFHERLVRFWSNHFTVAIKNPLTTVLVGAYEREAIRPNILGSFSDLALSAIFHQGMLIYLDNWQSIGPASRAGTRRDRGLNENLAREVMELHTVTPEAGYTQDDVKELARALTGWTIANPKRTSNNLGQTIFVEQFHQPGAKTVLGKTIKADGPDQAREFIKNLARHPSTARHISFKLARHFSADEPDPKLVGSLQRSFLESDGNLRAMYETLIKAPQLWIEEQNKVKTPEELLTSTARLLGVSTAFAGSPRSVMTSLAQSPFSAKSPQGWPDQAEHWIGPDSVSKRIEWANHLAQRTDGLDAREIMVEALGDQLSKQTYQAISRAESYSQALALGLLSPEFQRR